MIHRLKHVLKRKTFDMPMTGIIEVDETYVGDNAKNKHKSKRVQGTQGRITLVKATVFGRVQRGGCIIAMTVTGIFTDDLQPIIEEHVAVGSKIMSDEWKAYMQLHSLYEHSIDTVAVNTLIVT